MSEIAHISSVHSLAPALGARSLRALARLALDVVARWRHRARSRRALAAMAEDPHILRDLGLERWQVSAETDKPFWTA